MIIGGLLGSAVGNKLSDSNGAGSAGAVAGALLGREHANKSAQSGKLSAIASRKSVRPTVWFMKKWSKKSPATGSG